MCVHAYFYLWVLQWLFASVAHFGTLDLLHGLCICFGLYVCLFVRVCPCVSLLACLFPCLLICLCCLVVWFACLFVSFFVSIFLCLFACLCYFNTCFLLRSLPSHALSPFHLITRLYKFVFLLIFVEHGPDMKFLCYHIMSTAASMPTGILHASAGPPQKTLFVHTSTLGQARPWKHYCQTGKVNAARKCHLFQHQGAMRQPSSLRAGSRAL